MVYYKSPNPTWIIFCILISLKIEYRLSLFFLETHVILLIAKTLGRRLQFLTKAEENTDSLA